MKKFFTFLVVALMALATQAETLTVCENAVSTSRYVIYGYYDNYGDCNKTCVRLVYPADSLTNMVNGKITQVKFYMKNPSVSYGGKVEMSFMIHEDPYIIRGQHETEIGDGMYVGYGAPVAGESELIFNLEQPYEYTGGHLLIRTVVTEDFDYINPWSEEFLCYSKHNINGCPSVIYNYDSADIVYYNSIMNAMDDMPKMTFTYERAGEPTEKTGAPTFHGYTEDGIHAYFVEIVPTEPSTIYYRVQYPVGTWTEWAEYTEILSFTGNGKHRVEAYAIAQGKAKSEEIAYEFVVSPATGIDEVASGKHVAAVRYFNMAGQEMLQAQGLTLVVTTYSDGTTSTEKIVK